MKKILFLLFIISIFISCVSTDDKPEYYRSNHFNSSDDRYPSNNIYKAPELQNEKSLNILPGKEAAGNSEGDNSYLILSKPDDTKLLPFNGNKSKFAILLDPGHGGKDSGGKANGITEKKLVLKVANILRNYLRKNGFKVYFTRTKDEYPTLPERVALAKSFNATFMLSIHANICSNPTVRGTLSIYSANISRRNKNRWKILSLSKRLADAIENQFKLEKGIISRGVYKDVRMLYLLRKAEVPTVISEIGFMSNKSEAKLLKTAKYQDRIARILYISIIVFLRTLKL